MDNKILSSSLTSVSELIKDKKVSPLELVEKTLNRIDKLDPLLNSFISIDREGSIKEAKIIEKELKTNYKGPLHGIPIGVKDNIDTKDLKTTYGSMIYKDYLPKNNAIVIKHLKAAGAIIIGKHNTHQFAYGPTGDRSHHGATKNPYNTTKMTGGSSSGSAAAVAACLNYGAIGTDTGGSIRIPSAFCGIVGMKPTYGTISKRGIYPLSRILDHVGPMTRTIKDNALLLNVIHKYDPKDPYAIYRRSEDFTRFIGESVKNKVIGVPTNFFYDNLNDQVLQNIEETKEVFEHLGAKIAYIQIRDLDKMLDSQRLILRRDAYSIHERKLKQFPNLFDKEVKNRLLTGFDVKVSEYTTALQDRHIAKKEFNRVLEKVDVILTPTTPILPPNINERYPSDDKGDSGHIRSIITQQTAPLNLNGFPSLSLPCGYSDEGMPIGIQLIGRQFEEAKLYQFGYALEHVLSLETDKRNINQQI